MSIGISAHPLLVGFSLALLENALQSHSSSSVRSENITRAIRSTSIINKSIQEVFEFTTNPKNTHLWIPSIQKEIAKEFPPKIGTQYKNRGKNSEWDFYKVVEYELNKIFTLSDLNGNYHIRYTYKKLSDDQTEMEYFEWMKDGELKNPFTEDVLQNLKSVMEQN